MEIVKRENIEVTDFKEIFQKESHHDHPVVKDEMGTLRWQEDPTVRDIINRTNLNDIWMLFHHMGLTKNSEEVRKLYRDMGYSLSGYWEVFYWEMNNEDAKKYKPKKKKRA